MKLAIVISNISVTLLLFFGIQDAIGKERTQRLEELWLSHANRLFETWRTSLSTSIAWWSWMFGLMLLEVITLILLALICWPYTFINPGFWKVVYLFVSLLGIGTIGMTHNDIIVKILSQFPESRSVPIEVKSAQIVLGVTESRQQKMDDEIQEYGALNWWASWRNDVYAYKMIIVIALTITIIPILCITAILIRSFAYLMLIIIWTVFFGPSKFLHAIACRTGAEGYFNIGKYILLIMGSIAGWFSS